MLGINDVVDVTGISAFTIRYYDKCGFFPGLKRDKRGIRSFTPSDVRRLRIVDALRKSGLSIDGIRYFTKLVKREHEENCQRERLEILQTQATSLEYQIAEAQDSLELLRSEIEALAKPDCAKQ